MVLRKHMPVASHSTQLSSKRTYGPPCLQSPKPLQLDRKKRIRDNTLSTRGKEEAILVRDCVQESMVHILYS